jgi:hypothetical protein
MFTANFSSISAIYRGVDDAQKLQDIKEKLKHVERLDGESHFFLNRKINIKI